MRGGTRIGSWRKQRDKERTQTDNTEKMVEEGLLAT
jgi:hypothetical protein